jgi:hypothetical protein
MHIVARAATIQGGVGLTIGFIGSQCAIYSYSVSQCTHFTIHYSALHCLPSAESLLGWAQDLLQTQLSTMKLCILFSTRDYSFRTLALVI